MTQQPKPSEWLCRANIEHLKAEYAKAVPGVLQTTIGEVLVVEELRLRNMLNSGA